MPKTWPRITIVTPSYNQGRYLEETIRSVTEQGYPNLEYLIVDGASTDASLEIIRRYSDRVAWWVSEPDEGQAHAIHKGMERATGEVVNWINSDDVLLPGALERVARAYRDGADVILGSGLVFNESIRRPVDTFEPAGWIYPDCLRFWDGEFRYHQPMTFVSAECYRAAGGLDPQMEYSMDYDLYCRILRLPGVTVSRVREALAGFRLHADAKTSTSQADQLADIVEVSRRYWADLPEPLDQVEKEVNRYIARCSLHHLRSAVRRKDIHGVANSLRTALRAAPFHAGRYALVRLGRKVGGRGT